MRGPVAFLPNPIRLTRRFLADPVRRFWLVSGSRPRERHLEEDHQARSLSRARAHPLFGVHPQVYNICSAAFLVIGSLLYLNFLFPLMRSLFGY